MPARLKIVELLTTEEVEQLEAFAAERSRTVDEIHEWVQAHGYTLNRSAAYSWRVDYDKRRMAERFNRSGDLARAIKEAVSTDSFGAVADAAAMQLTQVVFEQSAAMQAEGKIEPLQLMRMTRSLANLTLTKRELTRQLADKFDAEMKTVVAKAADGRLTPEAIEAAGKAIFGL